MQEFIEIVINELTNPKADDFWVAWGVIVGVITSLLIGVFSLFKWFSKSRVARIERVLTFALVEDYESWVNVQSRPHVFDVDSLSEWLCEGKVALLGYDYSVFKNFMKRMKKNGREIKVPDEDWFLAVSEKYRSSPRWSSKEW